MGWLLSGEYAAEELNEPLVLAIFDEIPRLSLNSFLALPNPKS